MKIKILQACHGDTEGGFDFELDQEVDVSKRLGNLLIGFGYAVELVESAPVEPKKKADQAAA